MLPEQQQQQVAIQPQQAHQTFSEHYSAQPQHRVDQQEQQDQHHYQMMAHEVSLISQAHQQVKVDQEHQEHQEHREHQAVVAMAQALVYLVYLPQVRTLMMEHRD